MNAKKMFQVLVMGGASLVMGNVACGGSGSSGGNGGSPSSGGGAADAGSGGGGGDAGACSCQKDPQWPGNDCGPTGGTMVCCWLHPTAPCC